MTTTQEAKAKADELAARFATIESKPEPTTLSGLFQQYHMDIPLVSDGGSRGSPRVWAVAASMPRTD